MKTQLLTCLALAIVGASPTHIPTIEPQTSQPAMTAQQTATTPLEASIASVYAPDPTPTPKVISRPISGSKTDWMAAAGIPQRDWQYVDAIISKESGWRHDVWNTQGSGAYGLCQSKPAAKMASAGADYMTNPVTQLRWCHQYSHQRYHGWYNAWLFWQANHWW